MPRRKVPLPQPTVKPGAKKEHVAHPVEIMEPNQPIHLQATDKSRPDELDLLFEQGVFDQDYHLSLGPANGD
jgi:hypothetical protein